MIVYQDRIFVIIWNIHRQKYTVYKEGKFLINVFRFSDARCYTKEVMI
jgi:hypothetical protein